ncbi:MAG: hypothetical protein JSR37_06065 [Verrucomicrobia bacterium]|nr:hypothetical protein [Verrucomicrobiota bacterium]MBS0636056.1 hypothetical protein [Verrucomicrobiota bacterium]
MRKLYYSALFYGGTLLLPISPGELAWKLFSKKKGKIPLFHRDLICDTETLMSLPKSDRSLDECTTAFSPFIPLLTLNDEAWKSRRKILADILRTIKLDHFDWSLPLKKGDIYWDVYENLFRIGFQLIFHRAPTSSEFAAIYPGIVDINKIIKRQTGKADMECRWRLYHTVVELLKDDNPLFSDEFRALSEINQVSIVVEDLLTSICIQCSDLVCHLLLLSESFTENLDHCINETLRLYPLTDIWTRKGERGWIASLVQLNRSGWDNPNLFDPNRWEKHDHPPLISWGFDARGCPATKLGYNLSKAIIEKILQDKTLWIVPAANFTHTRTFPLGCQVWIGRGEKPTSWTFAGKWRTLFKQWFNSRLRLFDQQELW